MTQEIEDLQKRWGKGAHLGGLYANLSLEKDGLVLGAGTVLARRDEHGALMIEGEESRALTLLSVAYGRPIEASVVGAIRRASKHARAGDLPMASMHLALTGLPRLTDPADAARRIFIADGLLARGIRPRDIFAALEFDPAPLDELEKYSPTEPRNPKGDGRISGEWVREIDEIETTIEEAARKVPKNLPGIAARIASRVTINGSWDWRLETPADIGRKFVKTLDTLSAINLHFHSWGMVEHQGEPSKTLFPLEDVRGKFSEIVERGVYTHEDGEPFPPGGYTVTAVNAVCTSPVSVSFGVRAGGGPDFSRGVDFGTRHDQIPEASIVAYPVFKSVLTTLVSIWNVTKAQAFSSQLTRYWDFPPFDFDLDWMVYLSPPLAAKILPPKNVLVEKTIDGGIFLIAAEETFDTENPKHMQASRAIRDALAPINDLPQHERDKQERDEVDRQLMDTGFPGTILRRKPLPS